MDLDTYLREKKLTVREFAESIGAAASDVSNWRNGKRPVPSWRCKKIEDVTGGLVDRKTTRPDDWIDYWPELAEGDKAVNE